MQYLTHATGVRALRLLALSSAMVLAACGGGGDANRVTITSDNQLEVAQHAALSATAVGPMMMYTLGEFLIPRPPMESLQLRSGTPSAKTALPVPKDAAATVLSASIRKIIPAGASAKSASARLLKGVATPTTDTYEVECSTGKGSVTWTGSETENSYTETVSAHLENCQTELDGSPALIDGKLKLTFAGRYDPVTDSDTHSADLLAEKYSVKVGELQIGIDGDMHFEEGSSGIVSEGRRFSLTGFQMFGPVVQVAADETPQVQTLTLIDYRQEVKWAEDGDEGTMRATVETNQFGDTAIYEVSTIEALKYSYQLDAFSAGKYKIVGAENTTLLISADGDGTFKLERDDKGNGSIDETVDGLTHWDLMLYFLFGRG